MENEQGATSNEQIIWGFQYFCDQCDGRLEVRPTQEAAKADSLTHRQQKHGGLIPANGDRIEYAAIGRRPTPTEGSSSGGCAAFVIVATIVIAIIAVVYVSRH
ncbi:hypothetical protein [Streptomyces sp. NPDC004324]